MGEVLGLFVSLIYITFLSHHGRERKLLVFICHFFEYTSFVFCFFGFFLIWLSFSIILGWRMCAIWVSERGTR